MFGLKKVFAFNKDRVFTVLDLGSAKLKVLICQAEENSVRILGMSSKDQDPREMEGGRITDLAGILERAHEALKEAERAAGVSPKQLILGVSGDLIKGATTTITYRRRDPRVKIHQEELKTIIHKVQWKAFEKVRSDLAYETGFNEIDVKLVHAAIVDTKIDAYRVSNPIGFQGREVTMSVFNAFSPLVHYGALQTLTAELDRDVLAIMAEPFAVGRCLNGGNQQEVNAIFLDVGGTTTDLAIVQESSVIGTKMFNVGGRAFTKRLAHTLNVSHEEAEEIKVAFANQQLEHQSHQIVGKALTADAELWLSGVFFSLQEFSKLESLPPVFYLCGGGSLLPILKSTLEESDFFKKLPFPRKPQIKYLLPKDLPNVEDPYKLLHSPTDITPLALSLVGLEILTEEKILSKMLQKVVRLMQV